MISFLKAAIDDDYNAAALLFKEYAKSLDIDLSFQHFDNELLELKVMYSTPDGGIIVCKEENEFIGCVGVRKIDSDIAELKRMFIKPAHRKKGAGRRLLEKAIELATELNYKFIRLDTLNYMIAAINLYKQYGFYEIAAYYHNPNKTAIYFELKLND